MTPDNMHDDSLDPAIRNRLYTGRPAVDALNSTVPQADAERRDALEQRLMARVPEGKTPGKNRLMIHNAALQGTYETPHRFRISTSLLLTGAVAVLCAAVLVFASFNRPPSEELPHAVAPMNQDQEAATPTATVMATEPPTATLVRVDGQATMPPIIPATGEPSSVTDVPDSSFTATPIPFGSVPSTATYTVREGDTLVSIAERYYYDVTELIRLNGLRVDADLFVGQQLILPETSGMSNSLATATPVPFPDAIQLVPTFPPFVGSEIEPPMIWVPGNGNISAPNSSGLVVAIPSARLRPMQPNFEIAKGQVVNLYTTLSLNADGGEDAAGRYNTAMVSVAASTQVISVNDVGTVAVWVPLEQGIVLTWLLNDTPAAISYEQAE